MRCDKLAQVSKKKSPLRGSFGDLSERRCSCASIFRCVLRPLWTWPLPCMRRASFVNVGEIPRFAGGPALAVPLSPRRKYCNAHKKCTTCFSPPSFAQNLILRNKQAIIRKAIPSGRAGALRGGCFPDRQAPWPRPSACRTGSPGRACSRAPSTSWPRFPFRCLRPPPSGPARHTW